MGVGLSSRLELSHLLFGAMEPLLEERLHRRGAEVAAAHWLHAKKAEHERRVAAFGQTGLPQARFLEDPRYRVVRLKRIQTGSELWSYITSGFESAFRHPEPEDEAEVQLLGTFMQNVAELGDIHDDLPQGDQLRMKFELSQQLRELEDAGFAVYAGTTQRIFEVNGQRMPWPGKIFKIVPLEESVSAEVEPAGVG